MPIKAQGIDYNGYMICGINQGSGDPEPHLGVLTIGVLVFGELWTCFLVQANFGGFNFNFWIADKNHTLK